MPVSEKGPRLILSAGVEHSRFRGGWWGQVKYLRAEHGRTFVVKLWVVRHLRRSLRPRLACALLVAVSACSTTGSGLSAPIRGGAENQTTV